MATENMIVIPKNLDVSQLKFGDVQKNKMGGNVVYLQYGNSKRLTIQTPMMSCPFGVSCYIDEKTGSKKYSLDVSFKGADEDPKIKAFLDKMQELDEFLIDQGAKNSKEWLGKNQKKEVVEALYRPLVKPSKDPEKYAPTMKFKIMTNNNDEFQVEAFKYGKSRTPFDFSKLQKGAQVQCILEVGSIWFVNKTQFGVSFRLVQARVKSPDKISGYSFVKEDSDDEDEEDFESEEGDNEDVEELADELESTEIEE